jgi:hypothetical protein
MKHEPRYPELIGVKVPADLAAEIRRAAKEDDRTVSGYLRRLLAATLRPASARASGNERETTSDAAVR